MVFDPAAVAGAAGLTIILGIVLARTVSTRFGVAAAGPVMLIALAPLVPPVPMWLGLSLDDALPVTGLALLLLTPAVRQGLRSIALRHRGPMLIAAAGVVLVAIGGVASSAANSGGVEEALRMLLRSAGRYLFLAAIVLLVAAAVSNRQVSSRFVAAAISVAGTVSAVIGLLAYFAPLPAGIGATPGSTFSILGLSASGRLAGTTGVANFTAAVLMISAIVTAGMALSSSGRARVLWSAATVLQLVTIALTFTRMSLGLTILALVVLLVLASRPILLLPLGALAAVLAAVTPLATRFLQEGTDRLALWASAFTMMADRPLFGVGAGRMLQAIQEMPQRYLQTPFGEATSTAHNTILLAGAELGVLGALGVLLINVGVALAALMLLRGRERPSLRWTVVAGGLAVLAFLAQGMSNNLITVGVTGVFAALALASVTVTGRTRPAAVEQRAETGATAGATVSG